MTLKQALEIQRILGKRIPVDMELDYQYYSESREEWIDIADMDIVHAIRVLRKYLGAKRNYKDIIDKVVN
jgi:hypothetical protein